MCRNIKTLYNFDPPVTLEEVRAKIEALTTDSVLDYVKTHPAHDFTVLTIGPEPLVCS